MRRKCITYLPQVVKVSGDIGSRFPIVNDVVYHAIQCFTLRSIVSEDKFQAVSSKCRGGCRADVDDGACLVVVCGDLLGNFGRARLSVWMFGPR